MMLPIPRIIAIDDDREHLEILVQGLNQYGAACLPIHFQGDPEHITPCPHVRVIFADLNLTSGGSLGGDDHSTDFNLIGSLIEERIKPSGPYFIILWTRYPDQVNRLHSCLMERLKNVAKPFTMQALDKAEYFNLQSNDVKEEEIEKLIKAIGKCIENHPQFGALLNWEERVLDGAANTLSSITEMVQLTTTELDRKDTTSQTTKQASAPDPAGPGKALGKLLRVLAEEAVGKDHVQDDQFGAVNDALLPILADRIASMRSRKVDNALWKEALGELNSQHQSSLNEGYIARLNQLLHIEALTVDGEPLTTDKNQVRRGSVIELPGEFLGGSFSSTFGIDSETAVKKQFGYKQSNDGAPTSYRWVLVQTQAACDCAQNQPGPLPFHLGLLMPQSNVSKDNPPAAVWTSPCFKHDDQPALCLRVSARFPVSLTKERTKQASLLFRLREQLLNNLIYHIHGYGARPGFISFRQSRSKSRK